MKVHQNHAEPWTVTLLDTCESTLTGVRLKRVTEFIKDEESFCFTYGDWVSDVDITKLVAFHRSHGKKATLTATLPPGRYGAVKIHGDNMIEHFQVKTDGDGSWINVGFLVLSPSVLYRIEGDDTSWEGAPLTSLATDGELSAYKHDGFWQPMDTLREKNLLEDLWASGRAPWKLW